MVLEFYKDEKSACRGDTPKGFINIRDVVTVRRVVERRQCFEILCPGLGYRLIANSELEADEWTQAISRLICYKRDDPGLSNGMKSLSLTRVLGGAGHAHHLDRQRALSDSLHATLSHSYHQQQQQQQQQHQFLQPRAIPIVPPHAQHAHRSTEMHHLSHSLPTPPDSLPSPPLTSPFPPSPFHHHHQQHHMPPGGPPPGFQRQRSLEMAATPTLPSPPATSSDSSSLCSGSNTSFEGMGGAGGGGAVFEADGLENSKCVYVRMYVGRYVCIVKLVLCDQVWALREWPLYTGSLSMKVKVNSKVTFGTQPSSLYREVDTGGH